MRIKPSDKFIKESRGVGEFFCSLPFPPGTVTTEAIQLRLPGDAIPRHELTAQWIRSEGSYFFRFAIPGRVLNRPISEEKIGQQADAVRADLIQIKADGELLFFLADSGNIKFKYEASTQRLDATFDFKTGADYLFEGNCNVTGFDSAG